MADSFATERAAFDRDVDRFCADLERDLRSQAYVTAERIKRTAQAILRSKTHGTGKTAAAIVVIEEKEHQQFVVESDGDESDPANLPIWLEFGTVNMQARPYMRPARDQHEAAYLADQERVFNAHAEKGIGS